MNLLLSTIILLAAYIVGSLPMGFWIAQWMGMEDIRRHGSGNIGATNVGRLLGTHLFLIVLFLDAFKAFFFIKMCVAAGCPSFIVMLSAYALLIGNAYSFLLQGSGGKGVATFAGIMLALNPIMCGALLLTWVAALWYVQVVGIASAVTACMVPWYALFFTDFYGFLFLLSLALWILYRHKDNVRFYYVGR